MIKRLVGLGHLQYNRLQRIESYYMSIFTYHKYGTRQAWRVVVHKPCLIFLQNTLNGFYNRQRKQARLGYLSAATVT